MIKTLKLEELFNLNIHEFTINLNTYKIEETD